MATFRIESTGTRRWLVGATLTLAVAAVISTQLHPTAAHADLSPVAARSAVSPSVIASPPAAAPAGPVAPVDAAPAAAPVAAPVAAPAAPVAPVAPAAPAAPAAPKKSARPATSDVCAGIGWQAKRGQHALSTLRDTGQRSGVTVSFLGAKPGYLGLTYPERRHVDVFVRSCGSESAALLRHVISHEMGHAYDAAHMTPALRTAYLAMRGVPAGTPWFGCSYCTDFATPAGDFAETYSQWQRSSHDSRTKMAPMPGAAQLASIAAAFFQG